MKQKNKLITKLIILVLIAMPFISLTINKIIKITMFNDMEDIATELSKNNVHTIEIEGRKASAGMLYAQNGWQSTNIIN